MSQRRSYIAGAQVGPLLYAAGGMVGQTGRPLASFSRYDTRTRHLDAAAAAAGRDPRGGGGRARRDDLRHRRDDCRREHRGRLGLGRAPLAGESAAAARGLQPCGGRARRQALCRSAASRPGTSCARSTSTTGTPTAGRSPRVCPAPNHAFGAVAFRGELWVIGGRRGEEILREVSIWSPRTNRWRRGPAMPKPMELLGAAVVGRRDPRRLGVDLPGLERGDRTLAAAAGARRHPPRPRSVRRRRRALRRRRLHDRPAGQPGRGADRPALTQSPRCFAITIRCTSFVPSPISRIFWSR